jgi:hypothetical protein
VTLLQREEKLPIELTLKAARKRQSKQTGFVHFCYESVPGDPHETIPLFENACFALALFRSSLNDDIQEGKVLLDKLLAFEVEGNFPVYLHEYPHCKDRFLFLRMASAFFPLFQEFSSILGEELSEKLSKTIERIKANAKKVKKEEISKSLYVKAAALADSWERSNDVEEPFSSKELEERILAYSLLPLEKEERNELLSEMNHRWHPFLGVSFGEKSRSFQEKGFPAPSLYELFMGVHAASVPKRLLEDHPFHLQAVLLPFYPKWKPPSDFFSKHQFIFHDCADQFFTLAWGEAACVHTLTGTTKATILKKAFHHDRVEVIFSHSIETADEGFDICLFCNKHSDNRILINEKQANTFQLGDQIKIASHHAYVEIQFSKLEGEGEFFGHLSFANRPGQLACRGNLRFEVYDWQIALRNVQRKTTCLIKMDLKLVQVEDLLEQR